MVARPEDRREADDGLHTWRCWRCARVIARLRLLPGCAVEVRCKSCGALNTAAVDKAPAVR